MDLRKGTSAPLLYLSIFIIAICGIIYELIIGTVSSYLWGDSILYFSITIGLYMSAMGLGAFFSKFFKTALLDWFVLSEILIGLIGGMSALFLFWVYASTEYYEYYMVFTTVLIGMLVGLEIPWLIRLMEDQAALDQNVAHVLTFDYIGGLVGAMVFPLFLLPNLGLIQSSLLLGLLNICVAVINFIRHRALLKHFKKLLMATIGVLFLLGYFMATSQTQENLIEQKLYRDNVVFSTQTRYQHLTLTRWHKDLRLFINGGLQFSSLDEYRYHESLVHAPMSALKVPAEQVLVLGGGDGLAVRELLKYPQIKKITLVDLDPAMTALAKKNINLSSLNQKSLESPKVQIIHQDAYKYIETTPNIFDLILIDLPDPNHTALAKLYSREFYELLQKRLSQEGIFTTQSTSPFFAKEAFWCIHKTIKKTGAYVYPYQVEIPSFGNWGFQLVSKAPLQPNRFKLALSKNKLKFLNQQSLRHLFSFPQDLTLPIESIEINRIIRPSILKYYHKGWNRMR